MSKYLELTDKHMGGEFVFRCYPKSSTEESWIRAAVKMAFSEVARIEELLTDFKDSPFNLINKYAGVMPVKVTPEILDLIKSALAYSSASNGLFDISYASVGHIWRDHKYQNTVPSAAEIEDAKEWINYKLIEIDELNSTVYLPNPKMRIGLGGIGKGYAVDRAFETLIDCDIRNFYLNGSGDLRIHSEASAPRAWRIGIRNPFSEDEAKQMAVLQMTNGAIATSGNYKNFIPSAGKQSHHIIGPKSGESTQGVVSSTVLSDTAMESDVSATISMLLGPQKAISYLNERNLAGIIVDESGKVHLTKKAINHKENACKNWQSSASV